MKSVEIHNKKVFYTRRGNGEPVVLLHGYLESGKIWGEFGEKLADGFSIIVPDLPGHGKSNYLASSHTVELMAEAVESILIQESVNKCFLAGHSMGGYVALAFAEKYPRKVKGLVLLHSHPYADSIQKKFDRDREAGLIRYGRKSLLVNLRIPEGFAYDNHERLNTEIGRCISIAHETGIEGMLATLNGLKIRSDRSDLLKTGTFPVLWILGKKDVLIDYDDIRNKAKGYKNCQVKVLEESGHMGFIEEVESCYILVKEFIDMIS